MEVSHDEGLANRIGPESCGFVSNGIAEALTGERMGRVLSREILIFQGADDVGHSEGNTLHVAIARHGGTLRGRRPWHVWKLFAREPGDPMFSFERGSEGRIGKSEDVIR